MCICINCRHINNCKTYKFIEKQHQISNTQTDNIIFYPLDTIIAVNVNNYKKNITLDWDLKECSSFTEKPNNWNILK
uniref:Ycf34 n=1 Tax=Kapraunia schneideri TaxID=717899 RepID=A0A1Z1MT46_9FLOR|nr:hypothetical protein [Kapraunia schneideri]ARW68884.1 hypothetical protein [Kapraunia schneideri]